MRQPVGRVDGSFLSDLALYVLTLIAFGAVAFSIDRVPTAWFVTVLPLTAIPALLFVRPRSKAATRGSIILIFAVGVAIRLFFLGAEPLFSDDVYRYLWDGRVQAVGLSPYGVPPDDPSLDSVEAEWPAAERIRSRVNHPDIPTIYPPLLELIYRGVAEVGGALGIWRILLIGCDLAIAWSLIGLLKRRSRDPRLVALYLWHPLPVVENGWSAHAEGIAVALLVLAVDALDRKRVFLGGLVLGLGGAAKLLPFGLLPFVLRRFGWIPVLAAAAAASVCTLPFVGVDLTPATEGLRTYAQTWYFNDILYRPLGQLVGLDPEDRNLPSTQFWRQAFQGAWVLVCLAAMLRGRDVVRVTGLIVVAFILFTPTLHPWYVIWLLPFAIVEKSLAGVVFTVTVLYAYEVQIEWQAADRWLESGWVRVLELGPVVGIAGWVACRRRFVSKK